MLHLSSFLWPSTSVTSTSARLGTSSVRPTAGWPLEMSRNRNHARARANQESRTMARAP